MKKIFSLLSAVLICMAANAQMNLADVIKSAQEDANSKYVANSDDYWFYKDQVAVVLSTDETYVLDSQIDMGSKSLVVLGAGAKVVVKGEGQIATSAGLNIRCVNFDLTEATIAPIGLTKTPDDALKLKDKYPGANQDMYYNLNAISIEKCAFRNVANSVITANGNNWALLNVNVRNSIIQIADGASKNIFDFKGSIKNLEVAGNTIYSIAAGGFTKSVWYLGNGSNAQPQKAWGTNATAQFTVTNNTFANLVKNHADQWPSKNNVIVTAKNNIFYNVFRFQNKFVGNGTKDYTEADNIQYSDLSSSTVENGLGVVGNPGITVPTEALDLANIAALKKNFGPQAPVAYTSMGDPRWIAATNGFELAEGQSNQILNMSNALTKNAAGKYAINDSYPWISYQNSGSILDNGNGEVRRGGIYVSINPTTFENDNTFTYMVDDAQQWLGTPKVEFGYTKDAEGKYFAKLLAYTLSYKVKNVSKVELLLTGGGSNTNVADVAVLDTKTMEIVKVATSPVMAGKSNKSNAANTNSAVVTVDGLDVAKEYSIIVAPSLKNATVEQESVDEFGDVVKTYVPVPTEETIALGDIVVDTLKLTNIKSPAVYVAAIRLNGYGVAPICHEPGAKYAGTNYEVVKFSNYITTAKKEGADKNVLDEVNNPWMKYVNYSSVCDNGQYELSKGGHWASIDYVTGNPTAGGNWPYIPAWGSETTADFEYIFPDAAPTSNLGSPKAEMGYTKQESGDLLLQPKNISISVKNATKVELFLTGAGSNTNAADIIIKNAATGAVEKVITTDVMAGKSNKANTSNTNSIKVAIDLNASKRYTISVFPSAQYTQVEMASVDEFGDAVKAYVPFTGNWTSADTYTAAGLSNVKAPAVFVYAAHIYGTDLSVAPAAADALGDATAISNVETQRVAPKKYINAKGQIVIGNYNIAGQRIK